MESEAKRKHKSDAKETMSESRDTVIKKRRKGNATNAAAAVKLPEIDVYKNVIQHEEQESEVRDPAEDMKLFRSTCDEIRSLMKDVLLLKEKGEKASAEIAEKRISASLLFVLLKKLNRLEKFRTKKSRNTLHVVKLQVDSYHLQLQNLLYEILHLKKEVTKCREFKSKDEEIELVPVDQFFQEAPESISRAELTVGDPHQLKLARLDWELHQRKQLSALCHELQEKKSNVAKESQKKQDQLETLAPRLKNILEVTKPLQEYLGLPIDKIRTQHQIAHLLPRPLYILYVQADAYKAACDKLLSVTVKGDEEEARLSSSVTEASDEEDSDSDQETEATEDTSQNRHHRKMSRTDRLEQKKKQLLRKHPLWVELCIKLKDGSNIVISCYYMMNLHIVTVKCHVNLEEAVHGVSAGDLIAPNKILSGLFMEDYGDDSPNTANHYQLKQIQLGSFKDYIHELGLPYIWAQKMAGLDFMTVQDLGKISKASTSSGGVFPCAEVCQTSLESIIKAIRNRLQARIALCKQVQAFEIGVVLVHQSLRDKFPAKSATQLNSWQCITWSDYKHDPSSQDVVQEGLVNSRDTFYKAVLCRGTASLKALIAVKPGHPISPTMFSLNLHWNGERNARNDDAVRDMEREVNVYWQELVQCKGWGRWLLAAQMLRLMTCLDVYLEATGTVGPAPPEFPREKICIKPVSGRTRARPFKFLQVGGGIFIQR